MTQPVLLLVQVYNILGYPDDTNNTKDQKERLADTASTIRDNNTEPVPPSERVYPQHLIGVAIDFLEAAGVDWNEVRNVEELRKQLKI